MTISKSKKLQATEFDAKFEDEDITEHLDLASVKTRYPVQRISIDFPKIILEGLDTEAAKIGVTRSALIKIWVATQLAKQRSQQPLGSHTQGL
jgi:hypothetical protein